MKLTAVLDYLFCNPSILFLILNISQMHAVLEVARKKKCIYIYINTHTQINTSLDGCTLGKGHCQDDTRHENLYNYNSRQKTHILIKLTKLSIHHFLGLYQRPLLIGYGHFQIEESFQGLAIFSQILLILTTPLCCLVLLAIKY